MKLVMIMELDLKTLSYNLVIDVLNIGIGAVSFYVSWF
jgi:hypothetical protein